MGGRSVVSELPATRFGRNSQRVALAAALWVAASLVLAGGTFWWQAAQVGGPSSFDLVMLLPAFGLAAVSFSLRTLRWHLFLAAADAHPPLLTSLRTQLIGFSLTVTPGKVGELYKCYLVERRTGVPSAKTAPIVLFEKLMDAAAFATLALISAALLPDLASTITGAARTLLLVGIVGLAMGFFVRLVRPEAANGFLLRLMGRSRLSRRFASAAVMAVLGGASLLKPVILVGNAALSLIARTCDGLAVTLAVAAIGVDISPLAGIFVLNSSGVLGGLSMLPGGIGVVEASMSLALAGLGAPPAAALVGTLLARFLTFWIWVAIGLVLLVSGREFRGRAMEWPASAPLGTSESLSSRDRS